MSGEQMGYVPEENLEPTLGRAPTPEAKIKKNRLDLERELVKIELTDGRFVSGQALFRKQTHMSRGWEDEPGANQDTALSDSRHGIFGVFDGMGGLEQGAEASIAARDAFQKAVSRGLEKVFILSPEIQSRFAKSGEGIAEELSEMRRFVEETLEIAPAYFASEQDVEQALIQGVGEASQEILIKAPKGDTTVSLMAAYETADGKLKGKIINRGDSRVYKYHKGKLEQLTKDDSPIQFLADKGLIKNPNNLEEELSDEARDCAGREYGIFFRKGERIKDIRHYVTAGLAIKKQVRDAETTDTDLEQGDLVIAMTDGAIDNLSDEQLKVIIEKGKPSTDRPDIIAQCIATEAHVVAQDGNNLRSKPDDIGVVVTRIQKAPTLEDIFERNYEKTRGFIKTVDNNKFLGNLTLELNTVRNQAELALEGNPNNKKIEMLKDHLVSLLRAVGDRQAILNRVKARESKKEQLAA